jgi:hypothetical protein
MSEEIIIFNPIKSGIVKVNPKYPLVQKHVSEYIRKFHRQISVQYKQHDVPFYQGGKRYLPTEDHSLNILHEKMEKNEQPFVRIYEEGRRIGIHMRNNIAYFVSSEAPHPRLPIPIWNEATKLAQPIWSLNHRAVPDGDIKDIPLMERRPLSGFSTPNRSRSPSRSKKE